MPMSPAWREALKAILPALKGWNEINSTVGGFFYTAEQSPDGWYINPINADHDYLYSEDVAEMIAALLNLGVAYDDAWSVCEEVFGLVAKRKNDE